MQKSPAVPRSGSASQSPWKVPALPAGTACHSAAQARAHGRDGAARPAGSHAASLRAPETGAGMGQRGSPTQLEPWGHRSPAQCGSAVARLKSGAALTRKTGTSQQQTCLPPLLSPIHNLSPSTACAVVVAPRCSDNQKEHDGAQKAGPFS